MTVPFLNQQPGGPAQGQQGWQQVQGGYPGGQQPGQQQALPPGLQQIPQQQVPYNMPPQMQQPMFSNEPVSPLALIQPRIAGREIPLQQQQQQFQQQPQFQQQQQMVPPQGYPVQQQAPQQVDPNARLSGPGLPAYLQNRTVAEIGQMFEGMRQMHFQQQVQQQQPAPRQIQQQQQPDAQQQQGQQQQNQDWDWRKPKESVGQVVRDVIRQEIMPMLQPVAEQNILASARSARDMAAAELGPQRFAQLEPAINQFLLNADPSSLTNKHTWLGAARYVVGEQALRGQPVAVSGQIQHQPGAFPVQQFGQIVNPLPNMNGFFSEQPNQGTNGPQGTQLSANEINAARAMNISPADYAAFKQGIQIQRSY